MSKIALCTLLGATLIAAPVQADENQETNQNQVEQMSEEGGSVIHFGMTGGSLNITPGTFVPLPSSNDPGDWIDYTYGSLDLACDVQTYLTENCNAQEEAQPVRRSGPSRHQLLRERVELLERGVEELAEDYYSFSEELGLEFEGLTETLNRFQSLSDSRFEEIYSSLDQHESLLGNLGRQFRQFENNPVLGAIHGALEEQTAELDQLRLGLANAERGISLIREGVYTELSEQWRTNRSLINSIIMDGNLTPEERRDKIVDLLPAREYFEQVEQELQRRATERDVALETYQTALSEFHHYIREIFDGSSVSIGSGMEIDTNGTPRIRFLAAYNTSADPTEGFSVGGIFAIPLSDENETNRSLFGSQDFDDGEISSLTRSDWERITTEEELLSAGIVFQTPGWNYGLLGIRPAMEVGARLYHVESFSEGEIQTCLNALGTALGCDTISMNPSSESGTELGAYARMGGLFSLGNDRIRGVVGVLGEYNSRTGFEGVGTTYLVIDFR